MRRSKKKLYYLIAGIASIVAIFLVAASVQDSDGSTLEFTFTPPLAWVDQTGTKCYFKTTIIGIKADGSQVILSESPFAGGSGGKFPQLFTQSLLSRTDYKEYQFFKQQVKNRCDYGNDGKNTIPTGQLELLQGSVTTQVQVRDINGNDLKFTPVTKTIQPVKFNDNNEIILAEFTFAATDIDRVLPAMKASDPDYIFQRPYYTQNINFVTFGFIDIKVFSLTYRLTINEGVVNAVPVFVYKVEVVSPLGSDTQRKPISINSITQTVSGKSLDPSGTNKLDTTPTQGRQITVVATLPEWSTSEGNPTMILSKDGKAIAQFTMALWQKVPGTTADYQFRGFYTLPQNSPEGKYEVKVTINTRSITPTRNFYVENSEPVPVTPTATSTTARYTGKIALQYTIILGSKTIQNDVTKTGGLDITLSPLAFINYQNDRFVKMIIKPLLKLDQGTQFLQPQTSTVNYTATVILPNGKELLIKSFGVPESNRLTKDASQYIHFPPVELSADMISTVLRNSPDISQTEPTDLTMRISLDGSFTLFDTQTNRQLQGVLQDAGFAYFLSFDPKSLDNKCSPPLIEQATNLGIRCIDPNTGVPPPDFDNPLPPESTGGYCLGLTESQCLEEAKKQPTNDQCFDFFGLTDCTSENPEVITGNPPNTGITVDSNQKPQTTTGTALICDGTTNLSSCLNQAAIPVASGVQDIGRTFGLDATTTITIIVLLLILAIFIVIIARHRRTVKI